VRALCPSDYGESTDDDFRGIASIELSSRLAALAARTGNVTAILDCGYTAPLCRGAGASGRRARGVEQASRLAVSRHLRSLAEGDARRQVRGGRSRMRGGRPDRRHRWLGGAFRCGCRRRRAGSRAAAVAAAMASSVR